MAKSIAVLMAASLTAFAASTSAQVYTRITTDPGFDDLPTWSPDGTEIAFESNRSGEWRIHIFSFTDHSVRELVVEGHSAWLGDPAWSPDGKEIALTVKVGPMRYEIFVVPSSGGTGTQLTHMGWYSEEPVWTPDAKQIIFGSRPSLFTYNEDLFAVTTTGDTVMKIFGTPDWDLDPTCSPDGSKIAFATGLPGQSMHICVLDLATGDTTGLTSRVSDCFPAWSPDGEWIAFTRGFYGDATSEVYLVLAQGGAETQLTGRSRQRKNYINYDPSWSPDGSRLASVSQEWPEGKGDIWVLSDFLSGVVPGGCTAEPARYFELSQNYPNPFNLQTTIPFSLSRKCGVALQILDTRGRLIRAAGRGPGSWIVFGDLGWEG